MIKIKNVVIMLVVLVLLVGAVLAVTFLMRDPEDPNVDTDVQSIEIFKVEQDQIVQMDIAVPGEQFSFVKDGDTWAVKDRPEIKLRNSTVDLLAMEFASVNAKQKIADSADDLSIYGLEQPQGSYTVHLADGTQKQFFVGNEEPISSAYYFKMDSDPAIYTIYSTKATSLLKTLDEYRDTTFLTVDTQNLNHITIQNADTTIELALESDAASDTTDETQASSSWVMRQPMQREADLQRVTEDIIEPISSLSIVSFVDDAADHGLSNPAATVTLTDADGASQTMYVGDIDENGDRYVRLDGESVIYLADGDSLEFISIDPFVLITKFLNLENIDNVNSVDITADGFAYNMSITRDGENATYHITGVETVEDTFKDIYQKVIGLSASGMISAQPSGDPAAVVVYHLVDGTTETLQFYDYDDRNYAAVVNGVCEFRILKKDIDAMVSALQDVTAGTKVE